MTPNCITSDALKKLLNEKKISEDVSKLFEKSIQKNTDANILSIDKILEAKEKEIMQI